MFRFLMIAAALAFLAPAADACHRGRGLFGRRGGCSAQAQPPAPSFGGCASCGTAAAAYQAPQAAATFYSPPASGCPGGVCPAAPSYHVFAR